MDNSGILEKFIKTHMKTAEIYASHSRSRRSKVGAVLVDENNDKWLIPNEDYIFILPATTKPVKVALKGEVTLIDNRQPTGSEKYEAHKLMGVGLMLANDVCVLYKG